ncbi:unnamed protein product, partial [Cylicostephanus goldi]
MGGVPDDDDGFSRCAPSEESDHPPQLQAEAVIASSTGGASSDEAPPRIHGDSQAKENTDAGAPPIVRDDYTDDDDAPPQLSPANIEPRAVLPREMTEEEVSHLHKQQLAMDRPPKAPAMLDKVADDESESIYTTMLPVQSLPTMEQQCSSVSSQPVPTPLQQFPASLKQTTPGSVPSCQMPGQHTPEMQQQTFMSPVMQNVCAQPSSVSSVHSQHNSSLELAGGTGPSSQSAYGNLAPPSAGASAVHSDPSTPLRPSCQASAPAFGSPPQPASIQQQPPAQEMRVRTSTESVSQQPSGGSRRSGESSRSKHRSTQQQQQQQQQQQLQQQVESFVLKCFDINFEVQQQQQHMAAMHTMSFAANPYAGMAGAAHPQTYSTYPSAYPTHFDPTTAGFSTANPYWQASYPQYAAAKAAPGM